jgi:hypothetical protein
LKKQNKKLAGVFSAKDALAKGPPRQKCAPACAPFGFSLALEGTLSGASVHFGGFVLLGARQFLGGENGRERGFLWVGEGVFMGAKGCLLEKTTCGFQKSHMWF